MTTASKTIKALVATGALFLAFTFASRANAQTVVGSVSLGSQPVGQIAVDPNTDRVYVAGGYAQNQLTVVDASNPASPSIVTVLGGGAGGSGVTVNPNTNLFYTSNGFGGQVLKYSGTTNALVTTQPIGICPGSFDVDVTTNLVYVTRQCAGGGPPLGVDPLFVLNGDTLAIVGNNLGSGGVVNTPRVNSATGKVYISRSAGPNIFNTTVLGSAPTFALLTVLPDSVSAVNPVTNRIYLASGSDLDVRSGIDESLVATIVGAGGPAGVNTSLNQVYVTDSTNQVIKVIDGAANAITGSFSLGPGVIPSGSPAVDSTKNRVYVAGCVSPCSTTTLFVVQSSIPFAAFSAKVDINLPSSSFAMNSSFSLGAGQSIDPLTQSVTLQLGGFSTTIAAGSFMQGPDGKFLFSGFIDGVAIEVNLTPLGGGSYAFRIEGVGASNLPASNLVTVSLTIGTNTGSTSVTVGFQ